MPKSTTTTPSTARTRAKPRAAAAAKASKKSSVHTTASPWVKPTRMGKAQSTTPSHAATSPAAVVYQYILDQHPNHIAADTALQRHLDLDHFAFLGERLGLSLEDLSLYVLAFYLDCPRQPSLLIFESRFVAGLDRALAKAQEQKRRTVALSADDGYAAAFAALREAVDEMNETLWTNKDALQRFYVFVYCWVMQAMDEAARLPRAISLWQLFFRTKAKRPTSSSSTTTTTVSSGEARNGSSTKTKTSKKTSSTAAAAAAEEMTTTTVPPSPRYMGYHYFARLPEWLTFVQSPAFAQLHVSFDLWQQLLPFADLKSYATYSNEDAWPVALDEFVAWLPQHKLSSSSSSKKKAKKTTKKKAVKKQQQQHEDEEEAEAAEEDEQDADDDDDVE